ncbi:hypothetical protein N0V88_006252 [Collariella sp. IMI 366227]|nr:hypothetical protein N0V88_006252 [Collariella sp. IMI 366227]
MPYKIPIAEPIAVVGSSCRFAGGVTTPSRLWELLNNPTDLARDIPPQRFNINVSRSMLHLNLIKVEFITDLFHQAFYHPDGEYHGTTNSPKAYFIEQDHRVFDASFFNITPREAEAIDPQQRMLLEVVYEALESAGYTLHQYAGEKVAVFAGLMTGDYDTLSQRDELDTSQYYATGNARSILSNRISYFFNFNGPSMTIDTACSSSLVALHQAVLSLRSGECKMACVAGANLILTPEQFVVESNLHMLSPTGHCRMWDAGANGYARGEGIAALFIKTLSQALADGDHIEAIIRETGVNSDGRSRGITMPNWKAQSQLIRDTYSRSGLDSFSPEDRCQYFEAHGTGTGVGDPNEARAIEDAFRHNNNGTVSEPSSSLTNKLLVGSVKTVIGHTEGAAGLAGLLKVIQGMRHSSVPPNLHLEKLNPAVEKYYRHLLVPTSTVAWPAVPTGQPMRGSVNSFGFGGTNAHAIVEQYLPEIHDSVAKSFRPNLKLPVQIQPSERNMDIKVGLPLVLSAPSQKALCAIVRSYRDFLCRGPKASLERIAWHSYAWRTAFAFRVSVSGLSTSDLASKLNSLIAKTESSTAAALGIRGRPVKEQPKILGIFTGQGAQWVTMSRALFLSSEIYGNTIRSLDKILAACPDPPSWSLEQEILADQFESNVYKSSVSQPLCTAIQIGLVVLLRHLGITFHTVVGHSSGEIAAAFAAGRISMREAILISHYRGLGVHMACGANGAKGGMLAAGLSKIDAAEFCGQEKYTHGLWIAASNAPSSVTLSGDFNLVQEACRELTEQKKFARLLQVDTAYHSPHMKATSAKYLECLCSCNIAPTAGNGTHWVSSVYGIGEPADAELAALYWKKNMVKPVLFNEAIGTALKIFGPFDCAIEIGPHPALKGPVTQTMKEKNGPSIPYSGLLDRKLDDREAFANFLGWMWTQFGSSSAQIRQFVMGSIHPQIAATRLTDAPSYPWDHSQTYYRESRVSRQYHFKTEKPHELLGVRTRDDNKHQLRWRNILKVEKLPWTKHHVFQGQALLPASAYLVIALDAARSALAGREASIVELRDLKFLSGIILESNSPGVEVLFNLTLEHESEDNIEASFTLTSAIADGGSDMRKNFSGSLTITLDKPASSVLPPRPKERAETLHASTEAFYQMMSGTGLVYTKAFKGLRTLERRYNFSSGTLKKYHPEDTTGLTISPATLDSCLQTAFVTISSPGDNAIWTSFLPLDIKCVRFNLAICDTNDRVNDSLEVDAYLTKATPITTESAASFTADIEIFNPRGEMEIQVQGLTVGSFSSTKPEDDWELYLTTKFDVDPDDEIICADNLDNHTAGSMLVESCERVASFFASHAPPSRPRSASLSTLLAAQPQAPVLRTSWTSETEQSLDTFIRASSYFVALDFIRQLGKNLPDVLTAMLPAVIDEACQLVGFQQHVSRIVRQIAHKYPRMQVLGLTDPELGLTEHVFSGLQESFHLYHVGSQPEKNLESRLPLSDSLQKKIMVDKIDLANVDDEQSQLYDLVLLSTSLIESQKTLTVLRAIKRMMRPGGFLIMIDVSRSPLKDRIQRLAGFASRGGAPLSPPDWPDVLEQFGFAHPMRNSHQYYPPGFSLIIRQAESADKALLLHPFATTANTQLVNRLLVVGGKQPWTWLISERVSQAMAPKCGSITVFETLEDIDPASISSSSAIIFFGDIDEPVLASMTELRMKALRGLLRPQMTILWTTCNARTSNPNHAASFGFTRTLTAETPGLNLQMLDLDNIDTSSAVEAITETFARLMRQIMVEGDEKNRPMWTNEPEVYMEKGRRLIPRILPWKEGNDRVNSPRRVVTNTINTLEEVVEIVRNKSEDDVLLFEIHCNNARSSSITSAMTFLQVDYSTAEAVMIGKFPASHVCIGRSLEDGKTKVAFSDSNASFITVESTSVANIDDEGLKPDVLLALVSRYLMAFGVERSIGSEAVLLIEPDRMLLECLEDILSKRDIQVFACSSNATRCNTIPGMIYLHPGSPKRAVKALYPTKGAWVVDMCPKPNGLSEMVLKTLPANCKYSTWTTLLRPNELENHNFWSQAVYLAHIKAETWGYKAEPALATVPELLQSITPTRPFQIIDWKAERMVSQIVKPLAGTQLLSGNKTYVLVGLTRDFGQSLCTLFASQGARHLVLCSRNPPKAQPKWQTEMLANGIIVRFKTLDVTSLSQVTAFKENLAEDMPPVGGVVNGAMILEDRVFSEMSVETLHHVMRPKTIGSWNLDVTFCDETMDFFIMTSSFAAIGGHAGQSNYAAANMYMNGLAASRRNRGLPGSVLNIGVIYGLGFLHREKDDLYYGLEREGYPPISERDIHHMFVEAIVAGKPIPGQVHDITTGLRRFAAQSPTLPWQHDPRFSHFTRREVDDTNTVNSLADGQPKRSLKELIDAADGHAELVEVLVQGFVARLVTQLQLGEGSVSADHSVVELGVDSLAAVEIRAWIWKAMGQDVAVMKILGGKTIGAATTSVESINAAQIANDTITALNKALANNNYGAVADLSFRTAKMILAQHPSGATTSLKMLGVRALVIDKNVKVGDNWRKRYHQLVLHDPVWYDHLPYMPFPESWPVFTPKDKLADWFESYVNAMELNVWTQSEMANSAWDEEKKQWTVGVHRSLPNGSVDERTLHPKHIIMATGHSGKPNLPDIPGNKDFQGIYRHSSEFAGASELGKGKKAVVIGACNSSLDICQDYFEKGWDVTLVQRSSSYVVSSEGAMKVLLGVLYEEGGPPVEDSDIALWGWPSQVLKSIQIDLTTILEGHDKEMLDGLDKAGFKTDRGPHGGGLFCKYLQRGGGYYIDVGGAKLITDGKIKVKHGQEVQEILPRGLRFADGSELEADEIVLATGYQNMRTTAEGILREDLPKNVGDIWGWDEEGEMRTIWSSSGHPGLWFHGGNLAMCRYYSRLVALQVVAKLRGIEERV